MALAVGVQILATVGLLGCVFGGTSQTALTDGTIATDDTTGGSGGESEASPRDSGTPQSNDTTGASTTAIAETGPDASEESGSTGSTGTGGDGTEGDGCIDDAECPEAFVCSDGDCINPVEGDPCGSFTDCAPAAPICEIGDCWDGSPGDPCQGTGLCAVGIFCGPAGTCQAGVENDPCASPMHCGAQAPFCGPDSFCHDGDDNDSCSAGTDCKLGLLCGPEATCQQGSEGDPCLQGQGHCSIAAPFCPQSDDLCHDGSVGDPCSSPAQCVAGVYCNPDSVCQAGDEGDPCVANSDDCGPQAPFCAGATCTNGSVGDVCSSDATCGFPLHCGPALVCQIGLEGAACLPGYGHCSAAVSPFCGPDNLCHDGSVGDPCTPGGCAATLTCTDTVCG